MEALFCVNEEIKKKPVIIYGTEEMGKACLNELLNARVNVEGFCSSSSQECGNYIQGKRIISLDELLLLKDYNIVITVENYKNILAKLKDKPAQSIFMYRNVYNVCLM